MASSKDLNTALEIRDSSQSMEQLTEQHSLLQRGVTELEINQSTNRGRIVIVDNHQFLRELYKELLEEHQFEVRTLSDPEQLLDLLQTEQFQAIICESEFGDVQALEFLQSVRRIPELTELPLVILTSPKTVNIMRYYDLKKVMIYNRDLVAPETVIEHLSSLFPNQKKTA